MKNLAREELERGCYLYERGEWSAALISFQKAAKLGEREAQLNLANMLDDGKGCEKNFTKAMYWYKRAIKKKSPDAAYNLAISYRNQGKLKWFKYWMGIAVELGEEDAQQEINNYYRYKKLNSRK